MKFSLKKFLCAALCGALVLTTVPAQANWYQDLFTKKNALIASVVAGATLFAVWAWKSWGSTKVSPVQSSKNAEFQTLLKSSYAFEQVIKFPTIDNRIAHIAGDNQDKQATIVAQAKSTYPIMHHKVLKLIEDFLAYKKSEGSVVEKNLYKTMSRQEFIGRLLSKRPLMFMNANDDYLLKNGTRGNGGFEKIGTNEEKSPLVLKDYLSYDEMQIAALIGVSVPTYFINNGNRQNKGIKAKEGEFEEQGILVGLVGARFEKPGFMEWQHVIITKQRDTDLREKNKLMDIWSRFYNKKFQTYAEVVADTSARYLKYGAQSYFDTEVYKERMKMVVEPFLLDAHRRGVKQKKKVYVHAVGLGLGVWKVLQEQTNLLLNVYEEVIRSIDNNLSQISDIDFNWFPADAHLGGVKNGEIFTAPHNVKIKVHFSKRDPAEKLQGENAGKLLMAQYAWDGNSYPGNEYWIGALTASGDPAAACCSTIAELQNPYINSYLLVALQNN